ncbi:MAG TPA: glycoside hydrolase family 15 protein [Myxococcales bacterium]|nr:glycoside hydrolase family 15 protein [Myxococcales bacterium]
MTRAIADYAIVGDCRSAALISRDGSLDWLCWPRFDSPSVFAALLDPERGGRFSISPAGRCRSERRYLPDTNVLQTRFEVAGGELSLTDFMPVSDGKLRRRTMQPEHGLLRLLRCERGEADVEIVLDPRPDYARARPPLERLGSLGLRCDLKRAGLLTLSTDAPLGPSGHATVRLRGGQSLHFALALSQHGPAVLTAPGRGCERALEETVRLWRAWTARLRYQGPWREMVQRSALVLKLLQYAPSGAIVAAPTTSLPERPGGDLNWDYRFCWVRDAALTARALFGLGYREEAETFISWVLNATTLSLPKLHVLYDLFGRQPAEERELPHLGGFGGARPVRIGNAAKQQVQLDTYGEVIEAAAYFVRNGGAIDRAVARMLIGFGSEIARDWDEADEGIWEIRGFGRHFTHSRALCWSGLQRLVELHEKGHLPGAPVEKFARARDSIRQQIETLGWSDELQSYTRTLAGGDVDASLLLLPWYGYCKADSPRMKSTWRRIDRELGGEQGLVRRYRGGHLTAGEGAFGICSFWAAEYLALGGGTFEEAEERFEGLLRHANDVGLYAEEIDVATGAALGNFPQAFTHLGLVNAALSLEQRAREGRQRMGTRLNLPEARP